ncbi:hypothetical protein NQ318_006129 [Aromia moschata]|uniref:THAP-type domain-containing protein n=1 Tax=Aromia moschata TaxID=1265417 RepID=A0AAV8Z1Z5_9CUCU|nr:hypothetical protein NQ318_006129 [Aromia moschata]
MLQTALVFSVTDYVGPGKFAITQGKMRSTIQSSRMGALPGTDQDIEYLDTVHQQHLCPFPQYTKPEIVLVSFVAAADNDSRRVCFLVRQPRLKYSCKYPNCKSGYYVGKKSKHFFRFPRDQNRCRQWRIICNIDEDVNVLNYSVCEDHFNIEDITDDGRKKRLHKTAVPKLY